MPRTVAHLRLARIAGWVLIAWIVTFWRLGYPSFWDPSDEAHYAESSREMLAAGEWLVPLYNGQPFFEKPVLFHTFQVAAMAALGPTELAARLVPAIAAVALVATTGWLGTMMFAGESGELAALILATSTPMFLLSRYAILDMLFTAFLFGGASLIVVSALKDRPGLQYPGYLLVALAVLTKGPLALALLGLALAFVAVGARDLAARLLRLHWIVGLLGAVAVASPWFLWMWLRFGFQFFRVYALQENFWLYGRQMYAKQPSVLFYPRVIAFGMLPWTLVFVARAIDLMRHRLRGWRASGPERLLWAWVAAIVGFFSLSQFKLDHYAFPVLPALCLIVARAWSELRKADRDAAGTMLTGIGARSVGGVVIAMAILCAWAIGVSPLDLPRATFAIVAALAGGGVAFTAQVWRSSKPLPRIPVVLIGALTACYGVVVLSVLPAFEAAKPIKPLAGQVAAIARGDDRVGSYRLDRWNPSWRFYVNRPVQFLETEGELRAFLSAPGRSYCAMLESDYRELRTKGLRASEVFTQEGLFSTTGRGLLRSRRSGRRTFVVIAGGP